MFASILRRIVCAALACSSLLLAVPQSNWGGLTENVSLYDGQSLNLAPGFQGAGKLSYRWFKDGRLLNGQTGPRLRLGKASWDDRGAYTVICTDSADQVTARRHFFVSVSQDKVNPVWLGENGPLSLPAEFMPPYRISEIAAGPGHVLAVTSGKVVAAGDNDFGQCDAPEAVRAFWTTFDVAAGGRHSLALSTSGQVLAWGANDRGQCDVPTGLGVVRAIAAGADHSLALNTDNQIFAWGDNSSGQSTVPALPAPALAIAAGNDHSLALLANGQVLAWGANDLGQCDIPPSLRNITQIYAIGDASFAVDKSGRVFSWGDASFAQVPAPKGLRSVATLAGGYDFMAARLTSGTVKFWGEGANRFALDSAKSASARIVAIAAGGSHVFMLRDGKRDKAPVIVSQPVATSTAWDAPVELEVEAHGSGSLQYQWFKDGVPIPGATAAKLRVEHMRLENMGTYSVQVFDGAAFMLSQSASLGMPDLPPLAAIRKSPARQVLSPGANARFEIEAAGAGQVTIRWRHNGVILADQTQPVLEKFIASHDDAGVYDAELSDEGGQSKRYTAGFVVMPPAQPVQIVAWGANDLGQTNVPEGVQDAIALAAGKAHTLALRVDGTVVAWGDNRAGQCDVPPGLKEVVDISADDIRSAALCADGSIVVWGGGVPPVGIPATAKGIASIRLINGSVGWVEGYRGSWIPIMGCDLWLDPVQHQLYATQNLAVRRSLSTAAPLSYAKQSKSVTIDYNYTYYSFGTSGYDLWGGYSYGGSYDSHYSPNESSQVIFPGYGRNVVDFGGYNGRFSSVDSSGNAHFWIAHESASIDVRSPLAIDATRAALAGGTFHAFLRAGGGLGGFGSDPAAFRNAPFRLEGFKSWKAGEAHVVALVENPSPPPPVIEEMPTSRAVASGASVRLRVRATGRNLRYQWFRNASPLPGASDEAFQIVGFSQSHEGAYHATVTDGFATIATEPCSLTLGAAPTLSQRPALRVGLRTGERLELGATVQDPDTVTYQWLHNGRKLTDETGPTIVRAAVTLADAGRYTLHVTAANGAVTTTTSHVLVLPANGTRIVDERDLRASGASSARPWATITDAVDFHPGLKLALKIDGTLATWETDHDRLTNTESIRGLTDIVALSTSALLLADGRLVKLPSSYISPEAATLTGVIALIRGEREGVVLEDGRVGIFGDSQHPMLWLPSIGELADVASVDVGEKNQLGYFFYWNRHAYGVVALGADGSVVTTHPGALRFDSLYSGARLIEDLDLGCDAIDQDEVLHAGSFFGKLREPEAGRAFLMETGRGGNRFFTLDRNGAINAWKTDPNASPTPVPPAPGWDKGNLLVRLDGDSIISLRASEAEAVVSFSSSRYVFDYDQPATLSATVAGNSALMLEWRRNGTLIKRSAETSLDLPAHDPRRAGAYEIRWANAFGGRGIEYVYVHSRVPSARIQAVEPGSPLVPPDLTDVVEIGDGVAVLADGTLRTWDKTTGAVSNPSPWLQNVVASPRPGLVLTSDGVLRWIWYGDYVRKSWPGVLRLRDGYAIMRNGSALPIEGYVTLEGTYRRVIDLRQSLASQTPAGDLCALSEGTLSLYSRYSLLTSAKFEQPVADMIYSSNGLSMLIDVDEDETVLVREDATITPTLLRVFDQTPSQTSTVLGIDAQSRLSDQNGNVLKTEVYQLRSPWMLAAPTASN